MRGNFAFSQLIEEIENEIQLRYVPDAIRWADENFDGAWSKALESFDLALASGDPEKIKFQADLYRRTVLGLLERFRPAQSIDRATAFFLQLKGNSQNGP